MKKINSRQYDMLERYFTDEARRRSTWDCGNDCRSAYFYSGAVITDRPSRFNCCHFSPIACDAEDFGGRPVFCLTSLLSDNHKLKFFFTAHKVGECPFDEDYDDQEPSSEQYQDIIAGCGGVSAQTM